MVSSFEDGEVRSIDADMGKLALAIVVKSLFGEEVTRDAGEIGELLLAVADATNERFNSPFGLLSRLLHGAGIFAENGLWPASTR